MFMQKSSMWNNDCSGASDPARCSFRGRSKRSSSKDCGHGRGRNNVTWWEGRVGKNLTKRKWVKRQLRLTRKALLPGLWVPQANGDLVERDDDAASNLRAPQTGRVHPESQVMSGCCVKSWKVFRSVALPDLGPYTCQAYNGGGSPASHSVRMQVKQWMTMYAGILLALFDPFFEENCRQFFVKGGGYPPLSAKGFLAKWFSVKNPLSSFWKRP